MQNLTTMTSRFHHQMLPVLLFRTLIPTGRTTTKSANRRWQLPPTHRTSPIEPSCSIPFAKGFNRW